MGRTPNYCECRYDPKTNRRVYCERHEESRKYKAQPKRPIYYPLAPEAIYDMGQKCTDPLARSLFYFTYLTGGRISECVDFLPMRLSVLEKFYDIRMKTVKARSEFRKWRNVPIPKQGKCMEKEMWAEVMDWVRKFGPGQYPFKKWGRPRAMGIYLSRFIPLECEALCKSELTGDWSMQIINKPLHPHYLRHCRASHLVTYYGFTEQPLCNVMGWANVAMAQRYVQIKNVMDLMTKDTADISALMVMLENTLKRNKELEKMVSV